jgi:hypothetical protein
MRCKSISEPGRLMPALLCIWVAAAAAVGLFIENWVGWFLFFSPGWANGPPGGLSFQTVLSIGMTGYMLLVLATAAAGFAAIVGFICTVLRIRWEHVGRDKRIWFWFAVVCLCVSAGIFWRIYVWVWEKFPDGYDIT